MTNIKLWLLFMLIITKRMKLFDRNLRMSVLKMGFVIIENQFTQTVEAISKIAGWIVD